MYKPVRSRGTRSLVALLAAGVAALLAAQTALGAVTWSSPASVGGGSTYNGGFALARTTTSTTSYLHAGYGSDLIGGAFATDTGPYAGAFYRRGNATGTAWGTAKRLNPTTKHATAPAIVASGAVIYAAYVSIGHWVAYDPAEPRRLTVRINSNHGSPTAWLTRTLTAPELRVDFPALAAWGTRGFLMTYTNADTGAIMLLACGDLTIEASGCTGGSVGTTTRHALDPEDGFEGLPVVAAAGSTVAVAWLSADTGGITAVTGTPGSWSAPRVVTPELADGLSASARSNRFAFAWAQGSGIKVRFWTAGTWGSTRTVATVTPTGTYKYAYGTAVALTSTSTVGVAWAACRRLDCAGTSTSGVDLRWRESPDDGATWMSPLTVASYAASTARRINDFPSIVMPIPTKRFVMFNALSANGSKYEVLLRIGSG